MPEDFNKCVKNGGKIRTKKLSGNRYMHICVLNGKSYGGEIKVKKMTLRDAKKTVGKKQS